jgi:tetratricopeptide (TPR) repeat protein
MRKLIPAWTALMLALFFSTIVRAQGTGRLNGEVLDKEGKPFADLTIEIKNPDTGQTFNVKTDKSGKFVQLGMRSAIYVFTYPSLNYTEKFQVIDGQENNYKINFQELIAKGNAANPDETKKKEDDADKFKNMKVHFDNGVKAMADASDLQKQIRTVAADQKTPLQEKRQADCQTAITEFQQAEQGVGPKEVNNHALVWGNIGTAQECSGHFDDAAAAFQKAIDLKPQANYYSGYSTNVANSAAAMTDPKAAESKLADATANCDKALALDPAVGATCFKNVGIVLNNKGRQKDAIPPLQKATQANPQDAQTWSMLGSALTAMMDCKQEGEKMNCTLAPGTKEAYQKCIDIGPDTPLGKQCKEDLDGVLAAAGGVDTTVSKKKKKS